jgi:hypothetical protein
MHITTPLRNPQIRRVEIPSALVYFTRINTPCEFFDLLMTRSGNEQEPKAPPLLVTPDGEAITDFENYYGLTSENVRFLDCEPVAKKLAEINKWHLFGEGRVYKHICERFVKDEFFNVLKDIIDKRAVRKEKGSLTEEINWDLHDRQYAELLEARQELADLVENKWDWFNHRLRYDGLVLGFRLDGMKPFFREPRRHGLFSKSTCPGLSRIEIDMNFGLWNKARVYTNDWVGDTPQDKIQKAQRSLAEKIKSNGITAEISIGETSHSGDQLYSALKFNYGLTTPHQQTVKEVVRAVMNSYPDD